MSCFRCNFFMSQSPYYSFFYLVCESENGSFCGWLLSLDSSYLVPNLDHGSLCGQGPPIHPIFSLVAIDSLVVGPPLVSHGNRVLDDNIASIIVSRRRGPSPFSFGGCERETYYLRSSLSFSTCSLLESKVLIFSISTLVRFAPFSFITNLLWVRDLLVLI